MRKVALWLLVVGTLLACGTFNLDSISNTTESGSVPENGSAEHPFPATVDSPVTISVEPNEETFDPVLEILDSDGNVLEESDFQASGGGELLIFIPPATATYRVKVRGFSGEAGSYQISIITQADGDSDTAGGDSRIVPTASVQENEMEEDGENGENSRIPPTWTPLSGGGIGGDSPGSVGTAVPGYPPGTQTYTVQAGDTLANIAFQYGVTVFQLADANDIENIDLIEVGQILIIPR